MVGRGAVLVALLALSGRAEAAYCALSAGGVLAATHGARDWDLATSGTWVRSQSLAGELSCHGRDRSPWIAVQTTPTLWHTYDKLDGRYPMPVSWSYGTAFFNEGDFSAGVVASAGRAARGGGLYAHLPLPELGDYRPALDVRAMWFPGRDDAFQVVALLEIQRWERESGDLVGARIGLPGPDLRVRQGFEVGGLVGWRVGVGLADQDPDKWSVQAGLRAGVLTDLRREVALRPMVLGTVGVTAGDGIMGVEGSGGALFSQGEPVPTAGLALTMQGEEHPLVFRAGALMTLTDPKVVPDIGLAWMW